MPLAARNSTFPPSSNCGRPGHPKLYDVHCRRVPTRCAIPSASVPSKLMAPRFCSTASPSSFEASPCMKKLRSAAAARSPKDAETLLGWAHELGCNFVRLTHYPHSENMTRLADRMGLHGVVGNSGLLGHRLGKSRHTAKREEPASRNDCPRPQSGVGHLLVAVQRNSGQTGAHHIPAPTRRDRSPTRLHSPDHFGA